MQGNAMIQYFNPLGSYHVSVPSFLPGDIEIHQSYVKTYIGNVREFIRNCW